MEGKTVAESLAGCSRLTTAANAVDWLCYCCWLLLLLLVLLSAIVDHSQSSPHPDGSCLSATLSHCCIEVANSASLPSALCLPSAG